MERSRQSKPIHVLRANNTFAFFTWELASVVCSTLRRRRRGAISPRPLQWPGGDIVLCPDGEVLTSVREGQVTWEEPTTFAHSEFFAKRPCWGRRTCDLSGHGRLSNFFVVSRQSEHLSQRADGSQDCVL
jgi:hypothetical protein